MPRSIFVFCFSFDVQILSGRGDALFLFVFVLMLFFSRCFLFPDMLLILKSKTQKHNIKQHFKTKIKYFGKQKSHWCQGNNTNIKKTLPNTYCWEICSHCFSLVLSCFWNVWCFLDMPQNSQTHYKTNEKPWETISRNCVFGSLFNKYGCYFPDPNKMLLAAAFYICLNNF